MKLRSRNQGLLSRFVLLCAVLALTWLVTSCGGTGSMADSTVANDIVLEPTAVSPTASPEATSEPEPMVAIAEVGPDTCTDCHTDKDLLIDTADPVEEVVSENEGEG